MKQLFVITLLFCIYYSIPAQELIYRDTKAIIKCNIDTASLNSEMISYTRYDQEGKFQIPKSKVLYIKNFNGDILYPKEVIGIESSKHLHWPKASHYLKDERIVNFSNIQAGIDAGYTLCPACFDYSSPLPDQQIEKLLTEQALFDVRINLEILNGDKRLDHLNEVLKKVLNNWPEEKKGFEYRIQIYKGDLNAFSIPGGYIFVGSTLLDLLESDLELESILTHEVVHIEKRHALREWNFRQRQKNAGSFLGLLFATVATIAGEGKYAGIIISLVNTITDIVIDIRKNGYSRDLEEEADIMTLLYFQKRSVPLLHMKTAYSKLADYYWTRGTDIRAFSGSHPNMLNRINQIDKSETVTFKQPIVIECKENPIIDKSRISVKDKEHTFFIEVKIMNSMPSSNDVNLTQLNLSGNFLNEKNDNTYKIKKLTLISKTNDITLVFEGCEDLILPQFTNKEFFVKSTIDGGKMNILKSLFAAKAGYSIEIEVDRVEIDKKNSNQSYIYKNIPIIARIK